MLTVFFRYEIVSVSQKSIETVTENSDFTGPSKIQLGLILNCEKVFLSHFFALKRCKRGFCLSTVYLPNFHVLVRSPRSFHVDSVAHNFGSM